MSVRSILVFSMLLFTGVIQAQLAVGTWRDHLPYEETIDVAIGADLVFAATPFSVFSYSSTDNSIELYSKTNGLAESSITAINYLDSLKTLVVGYDNGNVDLIQNGAVLNINDIELSNFVGNKRINEITFKDDKAYLSAGFGIVVLDLQRKEVSDTWFINGQNDIIEINELIFNDDHWYASTKEGIFQAELNNPFLANFEAWSKLIDLPFPDLDYIDLSFFGENQLLALEENGNESAIWSLDLQTNTWGYLPGFETGGYYSIDANSSQLVVTTFTRTERFDTNLVSLGFRNFIQGVLTNPRMAILDENNNVWIASQFGGLLRWGYDNSELGILPDGPPSNGARRIDAYNDAVWVASGGVDIIWANNYFKGGVYGLVEDQWQRVPSSEGENDIGSINDYMEVAVDPINTDHVVLGSWEEGLIDIQNGVIQEIYNADNSPLAIRPGNTEGWIGVAGVDFDENGNLWITNTFSDTPLILKTASGTFVPMSFGSTLDADDLIGDVMIANNGYVWIILPRGNGLVVRDTNETITNLSDDNFRLLVNEEGEGGLPTKDVLCVEEDLDGEVWVGTAQGLTVFYAPETIFNSDTFDAQQILITQDGNVQILLETEVVTAIELDGANRKWVGTQGSGVFLFSADGLQEIAHFTEQNSPLLSNNVTDIALNQRNGEVFFATEKGISSYQGTATNFDQEINSVTVYPNPVEPDFSGFITIDGLAYETDVRITDVAGNAVFTTTSLGGRAIWDGNNFNGDKVSTGIYLVFCTNSDGTATNVGKVAVVR